MKKQKSTRTAVGDLLYVQMEMALKQNSCPLCWHMAQVSNKFFKFLLREGMNSDNIYQSLMKSQGLCSLHAQAWAETESAQGGKIGNATLYGWLLEKLIKSLSVCPSPPPAKTGFFSKRKSPGQHYLRLAESLTPKEPCLACVHFQQYEGSVVAGLSKILADPQEQNFRALFRQSYMLCLPHFRMILKALANEEEAQFILQDQQEKIFRLLNSINNYVKNCRGKHDEVKEVELAKDNSWKQALEFFYGAG